MEFWNCELSSCERETVIRIFCIINHSSDIAIANVVARSLLMMITLPYTYACAFCPLLILIAMPGIMHARDFKLK